jgi:6-phosphogluconolactonase
MEGRRRKASPFSFARNRWSASLVRQSMTELWIGTYAKPGGRGLYRLSLSADGALGSPDCAAQARNSSFGAYSARHGLHYLVDECDSRLGVWRRDGDRWERPVSIATGGEEPCYVVLDDPGSRLAVANYKSGSLALFALGEDGLPIEPPARFQDSGTGPVKGRQDGPHVHCVRFGPDGRFLYAVDLGADHVLRFPLDGARLGEPEIAYRAPPGSGPRHLLLHPAHPFALLISELASTLTLLAVTNGNLEAVDQCSTLPAGWRGENLGGHLAWPRTDRAYLTNRGHDSVALIEVDLDGGALTPTQHVPSGGKSPRHFRLLGRQMVVAHDKDGVVASFSLADDGRLSATGRSATIPGSCYVFAADGANG